MPNPNTVELAGSAWSVASSLSPPTLEKGMAHKGCFAGNI